MIEFELGYAQRKKYFFLPLTKIIAVIIVFTLIALKWFSVDSDKILLVVCLTWSWLGLMHILPLIVLATRHLKLIKGASFTIDKVNKKYQYKDQNIELSFTSSQIKQVVKVVSPPKYDNRIDILGFGYFFYWKVILVDGTTLSLSCMLLDSDEFFGYGNDKEKRMFPMPKSTYKPATISESIV